MQEKKKWNPYSLTSPHYSLMALRITYQNCCRCCGRHHFSLCLVCSARQSITHAHWIIGRKFRGTFCTFSSLSSSSLSCDFTSAAGNRSPEIVAKCVIILLACNVHSQSTASLALPRVTHARDVYHHQQQHHHHNNTCVFKTTVL